MLEHRPPIYFAQVREDDRLERRLVRTHGLRRVACVASGGCTALSLLAEGVERVDAIDSNPSQVALVELKKEAIRLLSREEYLAFVGEARGSSRVATYEVLRSRLPERARAFWDERRELVERGVNHSGVTEAFYRFVGENLVRTAVPEGELRRLMSTKDLEEQRATFREVCDNVGFETAVRVLLSRTSHLVFYPAAVFGNVAEGDFGDFFLQRFSEEVAHRSLRDNYFLSQLLFGTYLLEEPEGCPSYLEPERYERVKANLDALHVHVASLDRYLMELRGYDGIFLSNVFDWASLDERERIARSVVNAAIPGARVLFRQMLAEFPLPRAFRDGLELDPAASEELRALDRSFLYRSVSVGRVVRP